MWWNAGTVTSSGPATSSPSLDCLAGGGQTGALMRAFDWSATPVGAVDQWPQSLKTSVSTCLNSRFAILVWWGPELVMFYNEAYAQILGRKHPAALGAPGQQIWPEIWHIIQPMLEGVLERGEATWADDLLLELERSGYPEECYFTFSYSPIRDESGKVGGVFTPVQETTDRVIGERRLRTLTRLASAARAANAQTVDEVCRIAMETLAGNPHDIPFAALYLTGEDGAAGLRGVAGIDAGAEALREAIARSGAVALNQPAVVALPPNSDVPCGAWPVPPAELIVLPILPSGQRAGFLVAAVSPRKRLDAAYWDFFLMVAGNIATAVAEARAAEDERRRAEALAELDRAKTAFFSNVSHEFRTPLMLMLAPAEEALADPAGLPTAYREKLELIHRNGLRMRKLVDTLLEFSRIEAGRIDASYEPVDLSELTAELASAFRSAAQRAGLRLEVDCAPLAEPVYVDRSMWEKIVLNFLSNALKFTMEGTISVSLREKDGVAELTVSDTGIGIPESALPRIFERFYRVEGARGRSVEGSGIGLALVHELVRLHGGTVQVRSVAGQGSAFTVSIPMGRAHLPAERVRTATTAAAPREAYVEEALRWLPGAEQAVAETVNTGRPRILLADDNADMRDYICHLLSPTYEVETVADGRVALQRARERRPDLIVTDVMMPGLDGFQLLDELRADERTRMTPLILLSARAGEEARVEGLARGADDYLTKPFTARELLARVEARLELARVRDEALRKVTEGRRLLETLIANTPAGIALLRGGDYRFEWLNPSYQAFAPGRPMLGRTMREVWPDAFAEMQPLLDAVLESGQPYEKADAPFRIRRADGAPLETRYFSFSLVAVDLPDGGGRGVLNTGVETTERLSAEAALRATNERLERVLTSIADGYYAVDSEGRFLDLNPVAASHFGGTREGLLGRNAWELIGKDGQDQLQRACRDAAATGKPAHFEAPSKLKPGMWGEAHIYPRDGGVEVYFRDITDRKRSESAMRESEARFRRLFEANIVGIICAGPERITEANDLFLEMVGYTRDQLQAGIDWRALTPPEYLPRDAQAMREMNETGSFRPFEKEYIRKDGSRVPILMGGALLGRDPMECLCFLIDLTERKALERQILEAQKLESLGLLAGGIAHDFNNLLVGVMGNASLAQEMIPPSHPAADLLVRVISASEHAALLTNQMLAYSGKGRFVVEPVNLGELLHEILSIVQPAIPKNVTLRVQVDAALPAIEADRSQIQQIITNLVLNAAEAIGDLSGSIGVTAGVRSLSAADIRKDPAAADLEPGEYVYLSVDDTGCGMDEATRARIFDPFFTTKFTGRGLGLAAVAGIIRGHKGAIRVESAPAQGSSFTVLLPAAGEVASPPPQEAELDLRGVGLILLVDDESVVRQVGKRVLERYGYQVLLAESGVDAIEKFRESTDRVSAVLLDMSMPGMNGLETLVELRKIRPDVRVLLSSGYTETEAMRLLHGTPVAGFIQKPYTLQQLARKVKLTAGTVGTP